LLCSPIKHALIPIVSRLPNAKAPTQLANRDETLLIVLMNVVSFLSGTVLPDELGDAYAVVSTMNWDYAATAALAGMFALIFQEPLVNMGSLACEEL
jgi:hypothetical protein